MVAGALQRAAAAAAVAVCHTGHRTTSRPGTFVPPLRSTLLRRLIDGRVLQGVQPALGATRTHGAWHPAAEAANLHLLYSSHWWPSQLCHSCVSLLAVLAAVHEAQAAAAAHHPAYRPAAAAHPAATAPAAAHAGAPEPYLSSPAAAAATAATAAVQPPTVSYSAAAAPLAAEPVQHAAAEPWPAAASWPPAARAAAEDERGSSEPEVHGLQGVTLFEQEAQPAAAAVAAQTQAAAAGAAPAAPAAPAAAAAGQAPAQAAAAPPKRKFTPRERAVPSSSLGRVLGFAQLGSSLLYGTVRESVSRTFGGSKQGEDRCGLGGHAFSMGGSLCRTLCAHRLYHPNREAKQTCLTNAFPLPTALLPPAPTPPS